MAKSCGNCSSLVSDGDSFCVVCGQPANGNGSSPMPASPLPQAGPAAGQAAPNATYMGMRLVYQPVPEPSFDPIGNVRFLFQMVVRYLLYVLVYLLGACAGAILCGIVALALGFQAGSVLFGIAAVVIGLTLTACFWFLKIPIQLSEWKISVDNKGAAAPAVFTARPARASMSPSAASPGRGTGSSAASTSWKPRPAAD
jgi:hypothetical protein